MKQVKNKSINRRRDAEASRFSGLLINRSNK
nr:MAG TPA: hypothetical protein [Caudoviricetes sp.]